MSATARRRRQGHSLPIPLMKRNAPTDSARALFEGSQRLSAGAQLACYCENFGRQGVRVRRQFL
jgi:hypothetical protein